MYKDKKIQLEVEILDFVTNESSEDDDNVDEGLGGGMPPSMIHDQDAIIDNDF